MREAMRTGLSSASLSTRARRTWREKIVELEELRARLWLGSAQAGLAADRKRDREPTSYTRHLERQVARSTKRWERVEALRAVLALSLDERAEIRRTLRARREVQR